MQFIKQPGWETGAEALQQRLQTELSSGRQVLWLVSGGSNIAAEVQIMAGLPRARRAGLIVMPADERYGPPGHADANWSQLLAAGFGGEGAQLRPVLQPEQSFQQAQAAYEQAAQAAFGAADVIIAQLGIGNDGHVAGILPASPAVAASGLVCGYEAGPYQRLTLTFAALRRVAAAYVFAFGASKRAALQKLRSADEDLSTQPAQILKQLSEVYLYNDQVGE